jgi:hypothetical protein
MMASRHSNNDSNIETVKLLLEHGANPNLKDIDRWTALMMASRHSNNDSNIETVKLLLEHGLNPNLKDNDGWTALIYASKYSNNGSNIETVKLLLEHGANPNLKGNYGWTALMYALLQLNDNVIDAMMEIINLFIKYDYDLNIQDNEGNTILMQILNRQIININIVKTLLNHSININIKNKNNETALIIASKKSNIDKELLSSLIFYDIHIATFYEYNQCKKKLFTEYIKNNNLKYNCIEYLHIMYYHKTCMRKIMKELIIKIDDFIYRPSSIRTKLFFAYKNIKCDELISNYLNISISDLDLFKHKINDLFNTI